MQPNNLFFLKIVIEISIIFLSFFAYVFIFWKNLRDKAIDDQKIFDNLIIVSIATIIYARLFYVISNWNMFSVNILRILVIWKFPGFSFWGAIIGGIIAFIIFTRKQKLPLTQVFDGYGIAFPFLMLGFSILSHMNTWVLGKPINLILFKNHPVAIYSAFSAIVMFFIVRWYMNKFQKKVIFGVIGALTFILFGFFEFILAFFRDDLLYFDKVSLEHIFAFVTLIVSLVIFIILFTSRKFDKMQIIK